MSPPSFNRLLLTGAAGALGRVLRNSLTPLARTLRVSDIAELGVAAPHEEVMRCDLSDAAGVDRLLEGVDAVVHMGGISVEGPWEPILAANIIGLHNLYEAARRHGVKRVIFASSNHAIGFHQRTRRIDATDPVRPDGNYGVSKAFGEALSRFYWDRYAIETVCLRIGSSFPEPKDRRMLITWLSYADMAELVRCSLVAPKVEHTIVFGASNNRDSWWDNQHAAHLGFVPKDSAEPFRARMDALPPVDPNDPAERFQGGGYVKMGPYAKQS
jgi:uronate dehydrogenase